MAAGDVRVVTVHRFRAEYVETAWTVTSAGRARRSVDVLFPAWTGAAQIDAVLHDGTRVDARPRRRSRSRGWRGFTCAASTAATWWWWPTARAMHATARTLATTPQRYEPRPGSTLALRLVRAARFRRRTLTARIAPARDADEAARVAAALGAR